MGRTLSVTICALLLLMSYGTMGVHSIESLNNEQRSNSNPNTISNHSGFVTEIPPTGTSLCQNNPEIVYFDIENTTVFYVEKCSTSDGFIVSMNNTTDRNLLNITGWNVQDAVRLDNGTILFALSKYSGSSTVRTPFSSSNYDSTTFVIGYLLQDGTIGELPNYLDFNFGDLRVKFDMFGNAFLIGAASDRTQTATIGSTTLGWTSVAGGTNCWSVSWISPKFIAHYNFTTSSFDWVFASNYVTPNYLNGVGLGINKISSVLFFVVYGTSQVNYQCGSTPGTHTFGSHTTGPGQIVGAVDQFGTFLYAINPTISTITDPGITGHLEFYPQPIGYDGFVVEEDGSSNHASAKQRIFFNSTTEFIVPSDAPASCHHSTNTSYLIGGNSTNYTSNLTSSFSSHAAIHVDKTRDYQFHVRTWCLSSSTAMLVIDRDGHWSTGNGQTYRYILMNDIDNDDFADIIDEFPTETTQWQDSDGDGWGDNWGLNSWNLTRTGGIGEWVQNATLVDECPMTVGSSHIDRGGCVDSDSDGYSNLGDLFPLEPSQWIDSDFDTYGDNQSGLRGDSCPDTFGTSNLDRFGCTDSDYDGWSDENDGFPNHSSQWEDTDGDGYGDQLIGFQGDACPTTVGNSTEDRYGCPDADRDGWSDDGDDMPSNPTQWKDRDGDGYGDNSTGTMADDFPSDGTQWNDTDGDGHGDNPYGSEGDWFPYDPERWADADRDGVADEDDAFVNDATQWNDTDGDGYGDEETGNRGDAFPNDPEEWQDSDSDGVGNNADAFPFDPSQQSDSDGDGFGDNPLGSGADKFPDDPSQWSDIDGDGFGDNQTGTDADVFIADPTQYADRDGDGYGDSLSGRLADLFPDNPTQWIDQDGDGLGDNLSGIDADPYLFDFDNDGYNDSIDPLPMLSSPGDIDNDGCLDEVDAFPLDYRECSDFDGDGEGDNADTDDDNDGWTDVDEIREDTDPFDASDYPIEAFQLMIPGTTIGLDGWDLIGIFGGVPLFAWILFGFVTRNKRCRKYEDMLKGASTKKELDDIALKSEYSLMIRLLGPHQGIRLERLRAELDDALAGETHHVPEILEPEDITEDQTHIVEDEMVAGTVATGPSKDASGQIGSDGYEWTEYEGTNYFRTPNSGADWQTWKDQTGISTPEQVNFSTPMPQA